MTPGDAGHASPERSRFALVESLFHEALEQPADCDLARWLDAQTSDTSVRAEVRSLLEAEAARMAWDNDAHADAQRLPTARFGPYAAVGHLGRGGMSVVYRAHRVDGQFNDTVALKVLAPHFRTPDFYRRFERERQLLATLRHHHVATLIDGGLSSDGEPFLVTELVDGQPLDQHADTHRLDVPARLALIAQVCDAVDYAHRRQVVHGDIKPANILVNAEGIVKLLDFGTARLLASNDGATATQDRMLTPRYASPEQLRGERVTVASDIYSLGVLTYELLTGASPFGPDPSIADGLARAAGTLPLRRPALAVTAEAAALRQTSVEALTASLDGEATATLARALAFAPAERFGSAAELAAALEGATTPGAATADGAAARTIPPTFETPEKRQAKRSWLAAVLVAGLLGLGALAVARLAGASAPAGGVDMAPTRVTVAVLPLDHTVGDPALAPFVEVLADDLAEALGRVPAVRVTARTSTQPFAPPQRDVAAVGRALGVDHLVTGDTSRAGRQLQVRLRVVRTSDGQEIWTETYTAEGPAMSGVAQTAAAAVLKAIDAGVDSTQVRSDVTTPRDLLARDAYARGRYFLRQATFEGARAAVEAFDECRRIEPAFGRCHSGWGQARSFVVGAGGAPQAGDVRAIEQAMTRAVELEPGNAAALANLAGVDILYRYDWPAARTKYLRAMQTSPRLALEAYAGGLALVGRLDEAETLYRRALEWDPLNLGLRFKLAGVLVAQGRIDDVLAEYAAVDAVAPNHPTTLSGRLSMALSANDVPKALELLDRLKQVAPALPYLPLVDAMVLARTGRHAEALAAVQAFDAGPGAQMPFVVAVAYAQLGRPAEAVARLLLAVERHDPGVATLVFEPGLDAIRYAPEFRAAWNALPKLTLEAPYPGGPALRRP